MTHKFRPNGEGHLTLEQAEQGLTPEQKVIFEKADELSHVFTDYCKANKLPVVVSFGIDDGNDGIKAENTVVGMGNDLRLLVLNLKEQLEEQGVRFNGGSRPNIPDELRQLFGGLGGLD